MLTRPTTQPDGSQAFNRPELPYLDQGQLLAEWEAFISSGFQAAAFGDTLYEFLVRSHFFEPTFSSKANAWSTEFDKTAAQVLNLIEIFSGWSGDRNHVASADWASQVLADPLGREVFEAMVQIMDPYRPRLLAAWAAYIREIEDRWIRERVDEARYFNPESDEFWLRDLEADYRAYLKFEAAFAEGEVYMTDDLRAHFAQSTRRATRIDQPALLAWHRGPNELPLTACVPAGIQPGEKRARRPRPSNQTARLRQPQARKHAPRSS